MPNTKKVGYYNDCDILELNVEFQGNDGDRGYLELSIKPNIEMNIAINGNEYEDSIEELKITLNGSIEAEEFLKYIRDFSNKHLPSK